MLQSTEYFNTSHSNNTGDITRLLLWLGEIHTDINRFVYIFFQLEDEAKRQKQ
jgi:hypothetical protein